MNIKPIATIAISIAVGLAAVFAAAQWVSRQASVATVKVVVAKSNMDAGTRLEPGMLQVVDWPSPSAVKGTFSDPKALHARVIIANLLQGEPILEPKLAATGSTGGLSSVIAEGKRAITVKVNEVVGVAGFAIPGNRVDVIVNAQDEQNRPVSKIVLEQILVLAVAQDVKGDEAKPKVVNAVTLEVTPQQAEILDLARSVGTLSLVLRNQVDRASVVTSGAGRSDLLNVRSLRPAPHTYGADTAVLEVKVREARPASATPENTSLRRKPGIEVIRGVTRTTIDPPPNPNGRG